MTPSPARRAVLGAVAAMLAAAVLAPVAEAQAVPSGATPVRYYRGVVGINPLGIPFDIVSAEIEGAVAPGITAAAGLGYFAPDDDHYTSGDVKLRYYPGETALEAFSVGLGVGVTRRSGTDFTSCNVNPGPGCETRASVTGPTVSVLADYNFLLGPRGRFFVGTGVGAKRWIVDRDERERIDAERAWVFGRFLVGLAF